MVVIGLCGLNGGGKGVAATILKNKGFIAYSTSDILREECFKQGIDNITRDHLIIQGTKMRALYGTDVLTRRVMEKIYAEEGASLAKRDVLRGNYVVESIRNPGEVNSLRTVPGFVLWSIEADVRMRFERNKARKREADSQTLQDFERIEAIENAKEDAGQQLIKTSELADDHLRNEGSLDEFSLMIDAHLAAVRAKK